ncbi:GntR family transcriptional regulator [Rhodobacter sp. Har01]|uniref:GntR family transcriptional regulator n=1 Tax=Rhodobacter sp. Har01 TaxID=2883999 RepID=UPI001D0866A5|nr:GntR family transcriptional regulator [Rhodobacter sp. Har01]MCB6177589.1 GntR family transcriptional regulator [Rhodobacter sp. Har01]
MSRGWDDLRADLLARIRAREWPPGALIPAEEQLALAYGVARATVNRAVQALAEAGVVERRKRAGTRVATLPVRKARLDIPVIRREVEGRGQTYAHRLLTQRREVLPAGPAARLGLAPGVPALRLETLHLAEGRPYAYELRWLNPAQLPPDLPDFAVLSANEWLVATVPFVSGDLVFGAEPASRAEAAALDTDPGAPLLVIERTTRGLSGPITFVRLCHPPGHRVTMHL